MLKNKDVKMYYETLLTKNKEYYYFKNLIYNQKAFSIAKEEKVIFKKFLHLN